MLLINGPYGDIARLAKINRVRSIFIIFDHSLDTRPSALKSYPAPKRDIFIIKLGKIKQRTFNDLYDLIVCIVSKDPSTTIIPGLRHSPFSIVFIHLNVQFARHGLKCLLQEVRDIFSLHWCCITAFIQCPTYIFK